MAASKNKRLESVPIGKKDKKRPRLFEGALPQCQIPITVASKRESLISTRPKVHLLRNGQDLLIVSCRLAYYSEAAPAPSLNLVVGKDETVSFNRLQFATDTILKGRNAEPSDLHNETLATSLRFISSSFDYPLHLVARFPFKSD